MSDKATTYTVIYSLTGKPYSGCGHAHRSLRACACCVYKISKKHWWIKVHAGRTDGMPLSEREGLDLAEWMFLLGYPVSGN